MADISTVNLGEGTDSPKQARADLLEAVNRVNLLTRSIDATNSSLVLVSNNLTITGNSTVDGNLTVDGTLSLGNAGNAGQVLTSQGAGLPLTWSTITSGDKYKTSSTTNLTLDATSPKNLVVDTGLSLTAGEAIVVAHDSTHYFNGTVQSYDSNTGNLAFVNASQVGTGSFATWTVNLTGATGSQGNPGNPGTNGTNGATWYNGTSVPSAGLGANNDYYINTTNGNYYQKQTGTWTLLGNLTGVAGAAGSKWFTGSGVPSNGTGIDGDFYLNSANGDYYSKASGAWSLQGNLRGTAGAAGTVWYNGAGAPSAGTGVNNDYYVNTSNGDYYQKQTGTWTLLGNLTGPAGSGGSGSSTIFNNTSRYQAITTTGQGVTIISSASVKTGISWTRATTTLTLTDPGHGRSVGERAIIRNVHVGEIDGLITAVTTNTFNIACTDTGATSGSAGAYSMGFTFAYNGTAGAYTGGTVTAPANCDCVLLAVRMHVAANLRAGTTFNLTVPKGNINGAGPHTSMDDISVPIQQVRQDGNSLSAVGATISTNTAVAGDFATYQWAALSSVAVGLHFTANF